MLIRSYSSLSNFYKVTRKQSVRLSKGFSVTVSALEKILRTFIAGSGKQLVFEKPLESNPHFNDPAGLYLHIPLCHNYCSFCPYLKERYTDGLGLLLFEAIKREIHIFSEKCSLTNITSLYVGGGSPLVLGLMLSELVDLFRSKLHFDGDVAIEVHPNDITGKGVEVIQRCNASMISLGVQSFDDRVLKSIGRQYGATVAKSALSVLYKTGFDSLNVDLLFAIDGQDWESVKTDLQNARDLGATQITCYPLFTFPYTEIGRYLNLKKVKLPPFSVRKNIYYKIHEWCLRNGYVRTSVWSFTLSGNKPFSSVTRERFAGFGPSAGSYNGRQFYFNTFDITAYAEKSDQGYLPVALTMDVPVELQRLFWVYWRFYETSIDTDTYRHKFGGDFFKDFKIQLIILTWLKWIEKESGSHLRLTARGSHWLHLLQNFVALNYTSKLWEQMKQCAWPSRIDL